MTGDLLFQRYLLPTGNSNFNLNMKHRNFYMRVFGVGPAGLTVSVIVWILFYYAGESIGLPAIKVGSVLRIILIIMFAVDGIYLIGGSMLYLAKSNWGRLFIKEGPFLFVRHPFYSALIFSCSGLLGLWQCSWGLIIAVVPLAVFWSWLVRFEENSMLEMFGEEYDRYCENTGQFFPLFSKLNQKITGE